MFRADNFASMYCEFFMTKNRKIKPGHVAGKQSKKESSCTNKLLMPMEYSVDNDYQVQDNTAGSQRPKIMEPTDYCFETFKRITAQNNLFQRCLQGCDKKRRTSSFLNSIHLI